MIRIFVSIFFMIICWGLITPFIDATYPSLFLGATATTPFFLAFYWLVFSREEKLNYFRPLYAQLSHRFVIKKN